jgi:hypothetical protein
MSQCPNSLPRPELVGLQASFGFGDRLGLATPGHIEATKKGSLIPVFAQQSVREMTRTDRTPEEVMLAAQKAVHEENWAQPWGADADHLKTKNDVQDLAKAGFTFFTIDPSEYVNNKADHLKGSDLQTAVEETITAGVFDSIEHAENVYLNKTHELSDSVLTFSDRETLFRAIVKYGKAMAHAEQMALWIDEAETPQGYEIEVSVDETETPTSLLEHLFIGLELKRRHVDAVSVAPRFVGEFEKGIDFKGDLEEFESKLIKHVSVSRYCGPYKISVHSGSDKFAVYPILGRVCGNLLHVKTAGTSYLEALRVIARIEPDIFTEIIQYSLERFETDRATYHISANVSKLDAPDSLTDIEREDQYLNLNNGRQVLHVTFGSVLTKGQCTDGRKFRCIIMDTLQANPELHRDILSLHLGKHIDLLQVG